MVTLCAKNTQDIPPMFICSLNTIIVQYWIEQFKENAYWAFSAAYMAQEAVEYVLGTPFNMDEALDLIQDEQLPF